MYFHRFTLYHMRYEICARRRYVSSEKSGRDGQDSATCVLFRECHLSLPWTGIRGAPVLQCLGAWGGMVPHCECRCRLCAVASPMALLRWHLLGTTTHSAHVGCRACFDECLLLSGDLSSAIGNRGSHRVPWSHHSRSTRRTNPTQHWRTAASSRRWMAPHGCPLRGRAAWVCVRFCELCLLRVVCGPG